MSYIFKSIKMTVTPVNLRKRYQIHQIHLIYTNSGYKQTQKFLVRKNKFRNFLKKILINLFIFCIHFSLSLMNLAYDISAYFGNWNKFALCLKICRYTPEQFLI